MFFNIISLLFNMVIILLASQGQYFQICVVVGAVVFCNPLNKMNRRLSLSGLLDNSSQKRQICIYIYIYICGRCNLHWRTVLGYARVLANAIAYLPKVLTSMPTLVPRPTPKPMSMSMKMLMPMQMLILCST